MAEVEVGGNKSLGIEDKRFGGSCKIVSAPSSPLPEYWVETKPVNQWKNQETTFKERLALRDFISSSVWRASASELLGSAALVFMIDTIIISTHHMDTGASQLIAASLVAVTVTILVLATVPVSGGHINPTVTMCAAFLGLISLPRAVVYVLAQCTGAILGALALKAVVSSIIERSFSLGGCTVNIITPGPNGQPITNGLEIPQAFFLEIICSFVFLFASRWIAFDSRQAKIVGRVVVCSAIGIAAGLNVFISTTVTAIKGYSGAGTNPARCFGPAIVRGGHLWDGHWIYWVGPTIASVTFYLYTQVIPADHFQPEEYKHDFFTVLKGVKEIMAPDGVNRRRISSQWC